MSGITKPPVGTRLNMAHPLAQGLVGCWLMNENSGNKIHDYSGQGNTGTLLGFNDPPITTSGWNAGPHGEVLAFDGSNDYVDCGSSSILNPPAITYAIRVRFRSFVPSYGQIIGREVPPLANPYCDLLIKSNGKLAPYLVASSGVVSYDGTGVNTLIAGINYHIFMTYDSKSGLVVYVNEKLDKIVAAKGNIVTINAKTTIGSSVVRTERDVNCLISSVSIYNRALSSDEITYLYAFPYCMFDDPAYLTDIYNWLLPTGEVETTFSVSVPDISFVSETPQIKFVATK